ncbi:methionine ABC transporter ATP-binding protein, partial [Klebsiella pneumoniae]
MPVTAGCGVGGVRRRVPQRVVWFRQREKAARVLRLAFVGATAQRPVINHRSRECAVEVNILFASMSVVQARVLGFMLMQLLGEPDETQRAITHLVDAGVK